MITGDTRLKGPAQITLILFSLLLLIAIFFYRERIIIDAAWVFFHIINEGSLQIQAGRYGSFISQSVPLLGAKLGLPFQVLLITYSAGFNLFYLLAACLLYRARQYGLLILMGLYFTLYVSDTFFWPSNELHQGICWMFLALGQILYYRPRADTLPKRFVYYSLFSLLLFLAISSHMTVIIPLGYLWVCGILKRRSLGLSGKTVAWHTLLAAAIIGFKVLMSAGHAYDSINIRKLLHTGPGDILDTFSGGLANNLWKGWLRQYWFIPTLFLTGLYTLWRRREFLLLAWTISCNLGFFILLCIVFSAGGDAFYLESEFMPFAILAGAAFVYFLLPALRQRSAALLLGLIFIVRLGFILHASLFFCERRATVAHIVDYMRDRQLSKIVIPEHPGLNSKLLLPWALAMESSYISLLQDGQLRIAASLNQSQLHWVAEAGRDKFIDPFGVRNNKELQSPYYQPDTLHVYRLVPCDSIFAASPLR